jgi:hypothetical protein
VPQEQSLADKPELWMKSGQLSELQERMDGQVQLWPDLSRDLVQYCADHPEEVQKAVDILDCGKLTLPLDLNITLANFSPGLAVVPAALRMRLGQFLMGFMRANGQLAYIQSKKWFREGIYRVVIEINFYPSRGFDEKTSVLGVHKDTDSRNLFVNLIFNNPTSMPGTEWTMDESLPDQQRLKELRDHIPENEIENIKAAKAAMDRLPPATPGRSDWQGGAVGPNSYVSWVDELIWHSTPSVQARPTFPQSQVLDWFIKSSEDFELYFYEAMLIVSENTHGNIVHKLDWLKEVLTDQETWQKDAGKLRPKPDKAYAELFAEIQAEIKTIDWSAHKVSGRAGRVEVDIGKGAITKGRTVPTGIGPRPRANSVDKASMKQNSGALMEMRKGVATAKLPARSFIRTWVTLVKN